MAPTGCSTTGQCPAKEWNFLKEAAVDEGPCWEPRLLDDGCIQVAQVNLKNSNKRLKALENHLKGMQRPFDVIAFQDPPLEILFSNPPGYHVFAKPSRPITEDDRPPAFSSETEARPGAAGPESLRVYRVGFLVAVAIADGCWNFRFATDEANRDKVAYLDYLSPPHPTIQITNFYNVQPANTSNRVDFEALFQDIRGDGYDLILGDTNLHLPGVCNKARKKQHKSQTAELLSFCRHEGMKLLTLPYTPTWTRSRKVDAVPSTIDLAWSGDALAQLCAKPSWIEGLFDSDHRVIGHQFRLNVEYSLRQTQLWSKVERDRFRADVLDRLESLQHAGQLATESAIDQAAEKIDVEIQAVTTKLVEIYTARPTYEVSKSPTLEVLARRNWEQDKEERKAARWAQKLRGAAWRQFTGAGKWTPYRLSSWAKRRHQPSMRPHMGSLRRNAQDKDPTYTEGAAKAFHLAECIWTSKGVSRDEPTTPLSAPRYSLGEGKDPMDFSCKVSPEEINGVLKKLRKRKACGHSGVKNEALILLAARDDEDLRFECVLAHLFTACLDNKYFPKAWKLAKTVIIPKQGKAQYDLAGSWRPIALLSSVGKVLEGIVAHRLVKLTLSHGLLPDTQYAFSGRSTEDALSYNFNCVLARWKGLAGGGMPQRVSQLCLDMKGAYDRVVRQKLIDILARKCLPDALVDFLCSYLSSRQTTICIPGHDSAPIWVQLGIAQGSPLSSILFAFYSSPILEFFEQMEARPKRGELWTFRSWAYADDFNLIIWSANRVNNCRGLAHLHKAMMDQFGSHPSEDLDDRLAPAEGETSRLPVPKEPVKDLGVEFGPSKYAILHFQPSPHKSDDDGARLPDIPNLAPDAIKLKHTLLGVVVDRWLTFKSHVESIRVKVKRRLRHYKWITGPTWGLRLLEMRKLFCTQIRPIISYACAAWFIHSATPSPVKLQGCVINALGSLQYECLRLVAGAFDKVSQSLLERELYIESIDVWLHRLATARRARRLTAKHRRRFQEDLGQGGPNNPYVHLNEQARMLREEALAAPMVSTNEKTRIDKLALRRAETQMTMSWRKYQQDHKADNWKSQPMAARGCWRREALLLYKGLTRAQSTMLFELRTEVIGLNAYLSRIDSVKSPACSCGYPRQSVAHVLLYCTQLSAQRDAELTGHPDVDTTDLSQLLGRLANQTTAWAIIHLGLDQFRNVKDNYEISQALGSPFPLLG